MRKIIICFLLLVSPVIWARTDSIKVFQGCSGGMMLHTGYLFGQDPNAPQDATGVPYSPQGATFGIGGVMHVHLLNHLRIGAEGFMSTMNRSATDCRQRLQSGSYIRTGWGGLCMDACWRKEKVWPYIGGTIGGGAMRALYLMEGDEKDWLEEQHAVFHKQPFFCVDPYIGLDWCMKKKVHMTFRLDWLLAIHQQALVMPTGPRLYIGFMFCH